MKHRTALIPLLVPIVALVTLGAVPVQAEAPDPEALVRKVVAEAGGVDALRNKRDVEYTYIYRRGGTGELTISVERYAFDGEKSWARYDVHEGLFPEVPGPIVQGYDGKTTWQRFGAARDSDAQALKMADFLRKTNFYWFAMTFKLLDPGMQYTYEGRRRVDEKVYELVRVGFDEGVGDVADTYLLYIDPETWRIDQFLFTIMDFGKKKPFLMKLEYERVDGVLLTTKRKYAPADWSGKLRGKPQWTDEISVGIRFDNAFPDSLFEPPGE